MIFFCAAVHHLRLENATESPETPRCSEYPECTSCAEDEDCAWCASEGACLTVSEIFSIDCRGTVFDLPCPTSFVAGNIYAQLNVVLKT